MTALDIVRRVCAHRDIPLTRMLSETRIASVTNARREAMYLLRKHTKMSYPEIGRLMRRDHSTVISNVRTVEMAIGFYRGDEYAQELESIVAPISFAKALLAA